MIKNAWFVRVRRDRVAQYQEQCGVSRSEKILENLLFFIRHAAYTIFRKKIPLTFLKNKDLPSMELAVDRRFVDVVSTNPYGVCLEKVMGYG